MLHRLTLLNDWRKKYKVQACYQTGQQLYDYLNHTIIANSPICFLEFGVLRGATILYWAKLNTNENSEFTGFDSFEGLPETFHDFGGKVNRGDYSTQGKLPVTIDERVRFVKGWFQDTLPTFLKDFSVNKQLIIHCDADLYTSTLFTLCSLHPFINPGTIIIFDEFSNMLHEFRALEDYATSFWREYEILGASVRYYYGQVAIRITR